MGSDDKLFVGDSPYVKFADFLANLIERPVIWFRENIVVPNREEYYWYHEKINRVPTIDECYTDDVLCIYEANEQYLRDRKVDSNILSILRKRYDYCTFDNVNDQEECKEMYDAWQKGVNNFFIKYGDLGIRDSAMACYFKQKHRMAWERRHGPVGSGKRPPKEVLPQKKGTTC